MNILQSIAVIAVFFVAVFLLLFIPSLAQADNYHHHDTINITNSQEAEMQGTALSLAAAAHTFDWGTKDLQGSIGLGGYSGENALSFGIGKRYGRALVNGSLGVTGGEMGYSGAIGWHF